MMVFVRCWVAYYCSGDLVVVCWCCVCCMGCCGCGCLLVLLVGSGDLLLIVLYVLSL